MAKRLAAALKELEIWRAGGTVSEADRVALSSEAGADNLTLTTGEPTEEQPQPSGLSEQEREELLQRETELLDLLDDKASALRRVH